MKYHEAIAEYRLKHKREPLAIFIDDFEYLPNKRIAEWNDPSYIPHVNIAGDFIQSLDMRFVFGMNVHGSSRCERRAKALFKRMQLFKPKMCAVTVLDRANIEQAWLGIYTTEQGVICE